MSGYVYFLRDGDYVKIGHSYLPEARKRELEIGSAREFILEGMHEGSMQAERRMHRYFKTYHVRGEWFRWCPEIAQVAKQGLPQLIRGRHAERQLPVRLSVEHKRARFDLRRPTTQNVIQFRPRPRLRSQDTERRNTVSHHLDEMHSIAAQHEWSLPMTKAGVTLNIADPHEQLTSFLRQVKIEWSELCTKAKVGGRIGRNVMKGRPVAAVPYLRVAIAVGFDPMPELPKPAETPLADFDFTFFAMALRMKREMSGLGLRDAALKIGISYISLWRGERAETISMRVLVPLCRFIEAHPFRYLNPAVTADVRHETPAETRTA